MSSLVEPRPTEKLRMSFKVSWKNVPFSSHAQELKRSSNSICAIGNLLYIYGGEREPRKPVDNVLYEVNLESGQVQTHANGPEARVGASLVAWKGGLLLWGGRGGKAMTPLPGNIHCFDLEKKTWSNVSLATHETKPEDRSYHVMTSTKDTVYLHAGCPANGRSAALSAFKNGQWTSLPSAPEPARGGTVLALLHDGQLARFGGFAGYELAGPLVLYDPSSQSWSEAKLADGSAEPARRSVHGFVGLTKPVERDGEKVVAILLYGEAEPALPELGHDGAGEFHDDVWALLEHGDEYRWEQLSSTSGPSARGWLGVSPWFKEDGSTAVVLQGGLNSANDRLGDGVWILEIEPCET